MARTRNPKEKRTVRWFQKVGEDQYVDRGELEIEVSEPSRETEAKEAEEISWTPSTEPKKGDIYQYAGGEKMRLLGNPENRHGRVRRGMTSYKGPIPLVS